MSIAFDIEEGIRPLKRVEYEALVEQGAFVDERVELLYGRIVEMSPTNDPHSYAVEVLNVHLVALAQQGRARVRIQSPMAASEDSEPEPDLIVSPKDNRPGLHPSEALLIVEVADSSLRKDKGVKARLYAECGVTEYWVVNVADRLVEVYTDPAGSEYQTRRTLRPGAMLLPTAFPDIEVPVAALWAD